MPSRKCRSRIYSPEGKNFTALILAGGYATRLYPITLDISKPLLKINKKAIIDFSVEQLFKIKNLKEIIVVTNDKFYRDYRKWKQDLRLKNKITIINDGTKDEDERLGAVGDIFYVVEKIKIDNDLLVIGGDNIFKDELLGFINFAQGKTPDISIGIYNLKDKTKARSYGVVKINKDSQIIDFKEKPKNPESSYISMCVYYFPKDTLYFLKEYVEKLRLNSDKTGDYIKWLMPKIKIYGFKFNSLWIDIGQLDTYKKAQRYFS